MTEKQLGLAAPNHTASEFRILEHTNWLIISYRQSYKR